MNKKIYERNIEITEKNETYFRNQYPPTLQHCQCLEPPKETGELAYCSFCGKLKR